MNYDIVFVYTGTFYSRRLLCIKVRVVIDNNNFITINLILFKQRVRKMARERQANVQLSNIRARRPRPKYETI